MIRRKRCLELLEGLIWMGRQGQELEITFAGQGPLLAEIERRKKLLPRSISLSLPGRVPRREMPAIYRDHDLLILLSRAEGVSNVLLEALASGLCVLATPSAAGEVVTQGREGWLIEDLTPAGLGRALMEMAARPEEFVEMRRRAIRKAQTMSWEEQAGRFQELVEGLVRPGPGGGS
jgi:glycosyltransferase involved in cell wall biosynthesis